MDYERLPSDRVERELIALYEAAAARVAVQLHDALASGQVGSVRYRRAKLAAISDILTKLRAPTRELVGTAVTDNYTAAASRVDNVIRTTDKFGGGIHDQAMRALADNLSSQLGAARDTIGRRAEDTIRKAGLRRAALGLAAGDTRRDVSNRLRDDLVAQGMTSFQDTAGRRWKLEAYAAMAIRTTTREAVSLGTENRLLEHGLDLVTVSSHPGPADVCEPYEGKTFSLTGRTDGYPVLDQRPPFHPNCKHVLTPARENLEAFERSLGIGPDQPDAQPDDQTVPPIPPRPALKDRLQAPSRGALHDLVEHVSDTVGQVHALPDSLPTIPIKTSRSTTRNGAFAYIPSTGTPLRVDIVMRSPHPATTLAHELGHFLDFSAFTQNLGYGSSRVDRDITGRPFRTAADAPDPEMRRLLDVLRDSEAVQALQRSRSTGTVEVRNADGSTSTAPAPRRYVSYLLERAELFARGYAQWIATRSNDPVMRQAVTASAGAPIPTQWTDEDFEPIGRAFDTLFRAHGLLSPENAS